MFLRHPAWKWKGASAAATQATNRCARCSWDHRLRAAGATMHAPRRQFSQRWHRLRAREEELSSSASHNQSSQAIAEKFASSVEFPPASVQLPRLFENPPLGERVVVHGYLERRQDMGKRLSFARLADITLSTNIQVIAIAKNGKAFWRLRTIEPNSPVAVTGTVQKKQAPATTTTTTTTTAAYATMYGKNDAHASGQEEEDDYANFNPNPDRPSDNNSDNNSDNIELFLEDIQCLNDFPKDIIMTPSTVFPPTKRYLQIRNDAALRDALHFRARVRTLFRDALERPRHHQDPPFVEIETPLLFKSTPEGAREFIVPTRREGLVYALPQSPQQYKQILMASGIPRYYQFARCFRDEDLRADRQPEFTQLDMEMSFATGQDVMRVIEDVVKDVWAHAMPEPLPPADFPRMTYHEAMTKYGSDKPDTRIGMELRRIDHLVPDEYARDLAPALTRPIIETFVLRPKQDERSPDATRLVLGSFWASMASNPFTTGAGDEGIFDSMVYASAQPMNGLSTLGSEAAKALERDFGLAEGDAVIVKARANKPFTGGSTAVGDLRRALHNHAVAEKLTAPPTGFEFLWVHGFPLFSPIADADAEPGQGGLAGLCSTHHPFTAPLSNADVRQLLTTTTTTTTTTDDNSGNSGDPLYATADHYDLVLNGVELGGGSRRIHSAALQAFILRDVLKMPEPRIAEFAHLLDALRAGCPPHAGFALGFDRLVATMRGLDSVRDVIAFPKSGKGEDVMVKAPSEVSQSALETYRLRLREGKTKFDYVNLAE